MQILTFAAAPCILCDSVNLFMCDQL